MKKMIDTHCHLNDKMLVTRVEEIVNNFENDNLLQAIVVGYDFISSKSAIELAQKYKNLYAVIGMHPSDADKWNDEFATFLKENLSSEKVLALGEIGLDYHYENYSKEQQEFVFVEQLKIANECNMPIVIHIRDAMGDLIDILRRNKHLINNGGVVHCYNGSVESYKILREFGFKFSFGGAITFKNARNAPELLKVVDINDILLETDCPYLTPEPYRGKVINEPKYVSCVANKIAEYKGVDVDTVIETANRNTYEVFNKLRKN